MTGRGPADVRPVSARGRRDGRDGRRTDRVASMLKPSPELRYSPGVVFPEEDKAFLGRYVKFYRPEFSDGRYDPDEAPKRVMLESRHKAVPDFVTVHTRPALCPEARALIEAL